MHPEEEMAGCDDKSFLIVRVAPADLIPPKTSNCQLLLLISWNVHPRPKTSSASLALFAEGNPVCLSQMTCTQAGPRGHLLWHLNADQMLAKDIKSIHFEIVSSETQQSLTASEPVYLDQLFRQSKKAELSLSVSPQQPESVVNNVEQDSVPDVQQADDVALDWPLLQSNDQHHYSPLWMKTTGENVYRFDRSEPIYETLYPRTCCHQSATEDGELLPLPPPLPPRNNNPHRPLTRTNALLNIENSEAQPAAVTAEPERHPSGEEQTNSSNPAPPPPPRTVRAEDGHVEQNSHVNQLLPPQLPARQFSQLLPPALPKRNSSASPELPPRNQQNERVSSPADVAAFPPRQHILPSVATLPRYQRIQSTPDEDPLPSGWEARVDSHGRVFYVDHRTKTTSWTRPNPADTTPRETPETSNEISFRQLDRRYQTIRRTINRQDKRRETTPNAPPPVAPRPRTPTTTTTTTPATTETAVPQVASDAVASPSTTPPTNALNSPALQFITRPDFYSILHGKEDALQFYNQSAAVRQLITKIWRNPTSFQRFQHNRDLVTLLNLFADETRPLPSGWESRIDKHNRRYFIDHTNRCTWYIDPRLHVPVTQENPATISVTSDDQFDSGRAPIPPPRPQVTPGPATASTSTPVAAAATVIPTAYNEKVVAFLRQPNIVDILKERHPEFCRNNRLRDVVNRIRADGTAVLDRLAGDDLVDLTITLSLFEDDIMSYVPPVIASGGSQESSTPSSSGGLSSSPQNSPAPPRSVRVPFRQGQRDFETKLRHFYRKLESKGYGQGPNKFKVPIRRSHLLEDAYVRIMAASKKDLQKSKLQISFVGEDGLDYGGPSREFFFLLSRQLFNPYYGLFEYSANDTYTVQVSPMSTFVENLHEWFRFCGRILGLALVHQYLLDVFFTRPFYKTLLRLPVCLSDMESLDAEFHASLVWLKENDLNQLSDDLELSFAVTEDVGGQMVERELRANGRNIRVTEKNKLDYIQRMIAYRINRGVAEQSQSLVRGFYEVLDPRFVSVFDAREMELVLAGTAEIDVADWRKNTEYRSGYHDKHPVIQWFWEAIDRLSNEQRLRLIQFVTGTSSIPFEGFAALRGSTGPRQFCIEMWGQPTSLPRAHTCFNRLDLPPYENPEILYEKLTLAVEETSTFGIE